MEAVSDFPRRAVTRTAKLATLPVGLAGRTALGIGKRIGGRPAEIVAAEIQQRTAEQIFRVLGELKGGAMKFGQALSIFEAALPPELAGPYRATLTRLQEAAPPLPASTVHKVLSGDLGPRWRERFREFSDKPAAAASIGQVHRAVWQDGREVAVKIQYPGAAQALLSDFTQLSRVAPPLRVLMPGLEVGPLLSELRQRISEELDYQLEAVSQQAFADAYAGDPDIYVPNVVVATRHVLATEWMDGTPLSKIISGGSQDERDRAGLLFVRFLFSGPVRAGLLHADPHPGNFRMLADGRLGVLDFGAVDRLPNGIPPFIGRMLRIMHEGTNLTPAEDELREQGFLREGVEVDLEALRAFLAPLAEPSRGETFKFSREWLRGEAARATDPRSSSLARRLNLPPSYVLIHRVSTAGIGVLCQLGSEGPFRAEVIKWIPGYYETGDGGVYGSGDSGVNDAGDSGVSGFRDSGVNDAGDGEAIDAGDGEAIDAGDGEAIDAGDGAVSEARGRAAKKTGNGMRAGGGNGQRSDAGQGRKSSAAVEAGNSGTSQAGNSGTSQAGNSGTSQAGNSGTSQAGNSGTRTPEGARPTHPAAPQSR
jgi:predicted unusual protein kinase regulating ubiquinone biosynthesis (AarF/ABC1/UbiB family)